MGIHAEIYKSNFQDCSNGGISSRYATVCVVNASGPFHADDRHPAVVLVKKGDTVVAVPADPSTGKPVDKWTMFGGAYIACSDSRFINLDETLLGRSFYGAIAFHDRFES